ncbi:nuclear pore complex protein Nup107-like [Rhipicephalus microplus]|uniref:nuclear pore complex protein Nup107-like n=1 Tax=Rhipicephalus microplus TaxID=6941 RepID=UPI003F6B4556
MLPACTTWEDQLWARMRAVVDVCVEQELRTAKQRDRSLGPLPPGYPSDRRTFEAIFRDLRAAVGASGTRHQEITHILQRGVVLGDADYLVEEIHDWVTSQAIEPPPLTMRFLALMALLLRQIGRETGTEAFSTLLLNYISMLIDDGHVSLVDTYAAALKATDHVTKNTQLAQPPN